MIGDKVRALREERAWTQAHLADAAELSLRTVQRLEAAHACSPETLLAVAAVLEIDVRLLQAEVPARWRGPAPSRAARWGALLALPCLLFVAANLLKYGAAVPAPYDALAAAGHRLGAVNAFDAVSPFLFLGGPLAALALVLFSQVRPRADWDGRALTVSGVEIRPHAAGIAVGLAALAGLAILLAYLAGETLTHLARNVS
jgi:transcriptional regulator with XRE-family HTH domain